jgi:homoserine O-succinyltransferase
MPVYLDPTDSHPFHAGMNLRQGRFAPEFDERSSKCLRVGLINNMPDAALKATERQFLSLLESASEGMSIHLSLYALPGIPRDQASRQHLSGSYSSLEGLWKSSFDGFIVTGREPLSLDLRDEPYWRSFTRVLEWAQENTCSTVWSCLAAHAAILHMDDIRRVKSNEKVFGVFENMRVSPHGLTVDLPTRFSIPHSRWNGIREERLVDSGYSVLSRSEAAGVDTFIKQQKSLFVFFQGHPEYEPDTLLREYRRDMGRYFRGEMDIWPSTPRSYFDQATEDLLRARGKSLSGFRDENVFAELSAALEEQKPQNTWQSAARGVYRNWLRYLRTEKEKTLRASAKIRVTPVVHRSADPAAV